MRRQEYYAVGIIAALLLAAWLVQQSQEKDRQDAKANEAVQQTGTK